MPRQALWMILAGGFGLIAFVVVIIYVISLPTTLKVAVGPSGSENQRMIAALAQLLAREKSDIRLKIIPSEGAAASVALFQAGKADLAVLRSRT